MSFIKTLSKGWNNLRSCRLLQKRPCGCKPMKAWSYQITEFTRLLVTVLIGRRMWNNEKTNCTVFETCLVAGGVYSLLKNCVWVYCYIILSQKLQCFCTLNHLGWSYTVWYEGTHQLILFEKGDLLDNYSRTHILSCYNGLHLHLFYPVSGL